MTGAFKKNPQRLAARANEPTDLPEIGDPPAHVVGDQRVCWDEIIQASPSGVLKQSDRIAVELASRLLAKVRIGAAEVPEMSQLIKLLGQFGMNPSERSKVSGVSKPKENKFAALSG